jgi:DNA uptake protein ComE-like DNA-binding protein
MLRQKFVGFVALTFLCTAALAAQVKEMPRTPVRPVNAPKAVDINSAAESDIIAIGITGPVAKKIVDGRPYRNKRDLVARQVLTQEQYDKFKDMLVARRPKNQKK